MTNTIELLRAEISAIDRQLVRLVGERQRLAERVGRDKDQRGRALRDFDQEREVIERARRAAAEEGIPSAVTDELMRILISSALRVQEQGRLMARREGSGRSALVIGGVGRMGRWFVRFMTAQGFEVEVADPAGSLPELTCFSDWRESKLEHDFIVVAADLTATASILSELSDRRPPGVVFDIGSLKSPLRDSLARLTAAGVRATSIHPMFGPDTVLLSRRHVIFVDIGSSEATRQVRELFASTMAEQVVMDLSEHDRLIAFVLGLSHASNIAFFSALAESGEAIPRLAELSSTTFDAQLAVAARVAHENPHLYFEIQSLNEFGEEPLRALEAAVSRIRSLVAARDEASFAAMMDRGRSYIAARGS